jgi:hypothetical protein
MNTPANPDGLPTTPIAGTVEANLAASIPPHLAEELRKLEGRSPAEILQVLLPQANLPRFVAFLHGAGFPCSLPEIPEWAKNASTHFWRYYFGERKPFGPETIPDTGMFLALMEEVARCAPLPNQPPSLAAIHDLIPVLVGALHKEAQSMPPEQAADFYKWRAKGSEAVQRFIDPKHLKMLRRAPIYLALACLWEEFARFTSQADAYRWLREQKIIDDRVEIREVRAVFSLVGLRYRRPGRPRNSEKGSPEKPKS